MPAEGRTIPERISKLEAEMAAVHAEQAEADRLSNSVERLGVGASDLSQALRTVDENQQRLTRLGQELSAAKLVMADQATQRNAEHKSQRRRFRLVLAVSIIGLLLGGLVLFVYESGRHDSYQGCSARSAQNSKVSSYLSGLQEQALAQARSDAERAQIEKQLAVLTDAFKPVNCDRFKGWF